MKNKLICLGCVLGMVAVAVFFSQGFRYDTTRVHQHQTASGQSADSVNTSVEADDLATHLPIIEITTGGQKIPGNYIKDENQVLLGVEMAENGEETIMVDVRIIDHDGSKKSISDDAALESKANFRIRGRSSRDFDKKSYQIKLVQEDGTENHQEVMGMAAHDSWALNGPFLDKTLIRNYVWMNLSAEIMGYAPNVRFCEVILDGEYQGLYLMMETIDKGIQRVNLETYTPGAVVTDYIVKIDQQNGDIRDLDIFSEYTYHMEQTLEGSAQATMSVVYPSMEKLDEKICSYIENDFSEFEKALYSSDYKDPIKGYKRYIDMNSFVDYYILQEFLVNSDMCIRSTYLYKDRVNKIHMGPVWDYNNVLDNYFDVKFEGSEFLFTDRVWYDRMLTDEEFNQAVRDRYKQLRQTVLTDENIFAYIDETVAYLGDSIDRNYQVWGYAFEAKNLDMNQRLSPVERNPESYEEAISDMKNFIRIRGQWMDSNIDALAQYSHESKSKQYNNQ